MFKFLVIILGLALLYFATGKLSVSLALSIIPPNNVTSVWIPAPIGLAAILLLGNWVWLGIWLGDFLVNFPSYFQAVHYLPTSIIAAVIKASISTFSLILAAFLIRTFTGGDFPFRRARDVFKYVWIVMMCPMIACTVAIYTMCVVQITSWENYKSLWLTFWLGDSVSLLVFTPLLLLCKDITHVRLASTKLLEAVLLLLVILIIAQVAFGLGYPVEYLMIPCLVWATFRFKETGAIISLALAASLTVLATSQGRGTFIRSSLNDSLLLLQAFNGVIALTTLLLAAVLAERARSRKALITSNEQLETCVEERTATLVHMNEKLKKEIMERKQVETALRRSEGEKSQLIASLQAQTQKLETTLQNLKKTQVQLIQNEKMSSLGQLVAGIAHEINNPISFIYGNLTYVREYADYLLKLLMLYQKHFLYPPPEIIALLAENELNFIIEDLPRVLDSMNKGANRISSIVDNLHKFARLDETGIKRVDINESISSTLLILEHRLKSKHQSIEVIKQYGVLPKIACYPGELNQVFINIINNAIDALQDSSNFKNNPQIIINTRLKNHQYISISIKDTALGMTEEIRRQIFDPFFTTKPVGKGTGLGLAISHQIIVEIHKGEIKCISTEGEGTEIIIEIPITVN
ncbi:integral membrane sensor signal transduction histidine kinase [Calothrix sp. NIES-4071]|nr:integral membrane sensor signal transduction histidine kinase [Calothrix sp. NIES-4071]BAZ55404.1 integral membrane sensor signal transduction histidine kinase [Calothrix sp. NIES-4105]